MRRGPLALLALLALVTAACLANASPLRGYLESRDRLEAKQATVAALEKEKADLQTEVRAFEDGSRVELQARQDLTYTRPGEDVFIVEGLPSTTTVTAQSILPSEPDDSTLGLVRKLFGALRNLF
jgi:cell division protein FtsB